MFGALYASLLAFVVRLGDAAPEPPAGAPLAALGGERGWILLLVLGVWAYDTGAYFVGRRFGRRQFLTHISPSKTYAGLVGGVVACTVVVTAIAGRARRAADRSGSLLGPLLAAAAQAGDLAESMLKRAAGAKDSGTLIPGHGGILDRVDSFLFAAPVVTLYRPRRGPLTMAARGDGAVRGVALIGSTGSIGRQTVDVLAAMPDAFRVVALAAGRNTTLLAEQARRLKPAVVVAADDAPPPASTCRRERRSTAATMRSAALATRDDVDLVVVGTGGIVSLRPVDRRAGAPARSSPRPTRRRSSPAATS